MKSMDKLKLSISVVRIEGLLSVLPGLFRQFASSQTIINKFLMNFNFKIRYYSNNARRGFDRVVCSNLIDSKSIHSLALTVLRALSTATKRIQSYAKERFESSLKVETFDLGILSGRLMKPSKVV